MANFKLDLLVSRYEGRDVTYLASTITNYHQAQYFNIKYFATSVDHTLTNQTTDIWYNICCHTDTVNDLNYDRLLPGESISLIPGYQYQIHYMVRPEMNYSYNEKFSIHQNAQKDLSFNMDQKVNYDDTWMDNPFISALHIGTQLLLTDKYNQQHVMTITDISFKISAMNIVYSFKCQDSFHYQLTHQQTTYSIVNDASTTTFIGAKTLDYWAQKITKECFISYQFLKFADQLYLTTDDMVYEYKADGDSENCQLEPHDVKEMLKTSYTDDYYKRTFAFSSSETNPLATLISLSELLDCQIQTYEKLKNNHLFTFFWLEPVKKNNPTGLKYTPNLDIQNFNLSYKGNNLATVLNVNNRIVNDQVITMLPEVPSIFLSMFNDPEWSNKKYYNGMYYDFINGTTSDLLDVPSTSTKINIIKDQTITSRIIQAVSFHTSSMRQIIHIYYPYLRFDHDNSYSLINTTTSQQTPFYLFVPQVITQKAEDDTTESLLVYNAIGEQDEIPFNIIDWSEDQIWYIGYYSDSYQEISTNANLYLNNYRQNSNTEITFARVADACPWLENRLIDLNYLINHKIVSPYAAKNLKQLLTNDLRIINGQLLSYTSAYYTALHNQTQTLATITQKIDNLNAILHSDIIDLYAQQGAVRDYNNFNKEYNILMQTDSTLKPESLLNYYDILSDYLDKDFAAEQRFLHAMKDFRDFFETKNPWSLGGNELIRIPFTINTNPLLQKKQFYSFNTAADIIQLTKENEEALLYSNIYIAVKDTYMQLFIPEHDHSTYYSKKKGTNSIITAQETEYNKQHEYFITKANYLKIFKEIPDNKIVIDDLYISLTPNELRRVVLYSNPKKYYTRITDNYIPFDWIRYSNIDRIFRGVEEKILFRHTEDSKLYDWYVNSFDVDNLYYYGKKYRLVTENNSATKFLRLNEYDQDSKEYEKSQRGTDPNKFLGFQWVPLAHNIPTASLEKLALLDWDEYMEQTDKQKESWPYYSLCKNANLLQHARNLRIAGNSMTILWITPLRLVEAAVWAAYGIVNAQASLEENCEWLQYGSTYRAFEPSIETNWSQFTHDALYANDNELDNNPNIIWNNTKAIFARTATSAIDCQRYTQDAINQGLIVKQDQETYQDCWERTREYFNYYGLIAATYSLNYDSTRDTFDFDDTSTNWSRFIQEDNTLHYNYHTYKLWLKNPGFYYILNKDDYLNKNDQYYILVLDANEPDSKDPKNPKAAWTFFKDNKWPSFNKWTTKENLDKDKPRRFCAAQYSNILQHPLNPIDLSHIEEAQWKDNLIKITDCMELADMTLQDTSKYDIANGYVFQAHDMPGYYGLILRYEPYERSVIYNDKTNQSHWDSSFINFRDVALSNIYDCQTDKHINLLDDCDPSALAIPLYTRDIGEDDLNITTDFNNDNQIYFYRLSDGNYQRTYTISQIQKILQLPLDKQEQYFYYRNNNALVINSLNTSQEYNLPIYQHNLTFNDKNQLTSHTKKSLGFIQLENDKQQYYFQYRDDTLQIASSENYDFVITQNEPLIEHIPEMSNGEFWYNYHNRTEWNDIFIQCLTIETQLTAAWDRALTASKFCRFFLPDSWIPQKDQATNNFSAEILQVFSKEDTNWKKVQLSTRFIPKVHIYQDWYKEQWTTSLPKYRLKYYQNNNIDQVTEELKLFTPLTDSYLFNYSEIITPLCQDLSIKPSQVYVEENGVTTYYIHETGGITWREIMNYLQDTTNLYQELTGWYGMAFKTIIKNYVPGDLSNYNDLMNKKQALWTKIYKLYPNTLIEQDYKNDTALTSEELFENAQLYFQDQLHPEENYTLSLIDVSSLQGYKGQALQIGDAIQLDVDSWYDKHDDLYHSLKKFLFITDISYDLRKDDNMAVTVNTVKYQEKLLQQLVSLIK